MVYLEGLGLEVKRMILEISNLSKNFGGLAALSDVSFNMEEGQIMGLIGPNGAGKTTLFNCISGLLPISGGEIKVTGKSTKGLKPHQIAKLGVARTFQVVKPFGNMTTLENVMVGAFLKEPHYEDSKKVALEALRIVFLEEKKNQLAKTLNLGQRKRLEIAKALATKPKLLLLDEVMAGLTPNEVKELLEVVKGINKSGISILIIEHIMEAIMNISDDIVVINFGKKIAEGVPEDIKNNEKVIEAYFGAEEENVDA
jgi:branched-chain amino acid transport system ATP-binding protein